MTGLFYFLIKQAEFWKRGQVSALFILLPSLFAVAQNDTVRDDQASDYNLNRPERVEWFRNAGAGLFIHFSVDAQLGIVISIRQRPDREHTSAFLARTAGSLNTNRMMSAVICGRQEMTWSCR